MFEQASFDFGLLPQPPRPRKPERVFFCIGAGKAAASIDPCRTAIMQEDRIRGSPIPADRFHVSLFHVGDFKRIPSYIPFAACRAAERVRMDPFEIMLDRVATFPGGRPDRKATVLLGGSDALLELHGRLLVELNRIGLSVPVRFTPHMTLFYAPVSVRPRRIDPIRLQVEEFFLIHSALWLTRYTVLGRWPRQPGETAVNLTMAFGPMAA